MKAHLYSQSFSHGDAYIVADAEGLNALKDACDKALARGSAAFESSSRDGEGFALFVLHVESKDPKWDQLLLPYIDGEPVFPNGTPPFSVLGAQRYRELHAKIKEVNP